MSKLIEVTADTFEAEVLRSAVPVLVDWYGNHCGPCKRMVPILEDLAAEGGVRPPLRLPCASPHRVTKVYRASRDLFLAQRFARHLSPLTTTVYTHPSDEDMQRSLRNLGC